MSDKEISFPKISFGAKRAEDAREASHPGAAVQPKPIGKKTKAKDFVYYIREADPEEPKSDATYNYRVDKCPIINGEIQPLIETYRLWGEDTEELPLMCSCPSSTYGKHPGARECKHTTWVREVIEAQQEFVDIEKAHYDTREERVIFPKNV